MKIYFHTLWRWRFTVRCCRRCRSVNIWDLDYPMSFNTNVFQYGQVCREESRPSESCNHASTCGMVGGIFRLSPAPSPPRHCTKHYSHDSTPSPIAYQHEIVCSQTIFFVSILAMSPPTILSNVCSALSKK